MYKELYEIEDVILKKEILENITFNSKFRKKYFEHCFYSWCKYYFPQYFYNKSAWFHKEWAKNMQSGKHCLLITFRQSGKRMYLQMYIIWCIVYKKKHFIVFFSHEANLSTDRLIDIITQLKTNKILIGDYGYLFPGNKTKTTKNDEEGVKQRRVGSFVTTNLVKVQAFGLRGTTRGINFSNREGAFRPDLLCLDDIDVDNSVRNPEIINKNEDHLRGEVIGGMDGDHQVVFLGNVIANDGLVPRYATLAKESKKWYYSFLPIKIKNEIIWDLYVETDEEKEAFKKKGIKKNSLESKKEELKDTYGCNMLLVPNVKTGNPVFDSETLLNYPILEPIRQDIKYRELNIYEEPKHNKYYYMGCDTALGGPKGDYSTIIVRDAELKLILAYQGRIPPDELAVLINHIIETLGYIETQVCIENNNPGPAVIGKAKDYDWHYNLYKEKSLDTITGKIKPKYGFNTNSKTKSLILNELERAIRKKELDGFDGRELDDLLHYYYDDGKRMNALKGHHDDLVMAEALCLFMVGQGQPLEIY